MLVGPRTMSGEASAGSVFQLLRPADAAGSPGTRPSVASTMAAGVCHCVKCTRVCVDSVHMARAWAGGVREEEVKIRVAASAGAEREAPHVMELALTTVTINDGGVGAVLSMGTIGRSADGVWFKPCARCKGLAFASTHPHAFRWLCTDCGHTNVFARWRLEAGECVPPLWSCTWPEHAVMVKATETRVDVCFDTRKVLQVPVELAMVLRDMSLEWGLVSETAMAFATVVWCASRLATWSGQRFGERAMAAGSAAASVVSTGSGGWCIDDRAVTYAAEWTPRSTGSAGDLVSTGFAMDNGMEMLECIVEQREELPAEGAAGADAAGEQETAAGAELSGHVRGRVSIGTSAWAFDKGERLWRRRTGVRRADEEAALRERKVMRNLIELTQKVQSVEQQRAAVEALQQAVEEAQRTTVEQMVEVPAMLNHDRIVVGDVDGECKHSKKTVSTAPSVPMLIWQARVRAEELVLDDTTSADVVGRAARALGTFVNPFAAQRAGASPLWDGGVSARMWESTSAAGGYSLHTPAFGVGSAVNKSAFGLNGDNIARILAWHPQGAWIADGARYGFSLLSDGAVRRQEDGNPDFTAGEAQQVTEWMAKQVERGRTIPVSNAEARSLIGLFTSPVVGAPKPGGADGEIRTCHHLSAGGDASVNEGINFDPLSPIGLLQIDSVVAHMRYLRRLHPGRRIRLAKLDMKEFFRQIPLRRRDMARVTQRWNGIMNMHTAFTFGARSAPHVCSVVTNALCDEMARLGYFCQCFVDDCVIVGYEEDMERAVAELRRLIAAFGLIENVEKYVSSTHEVAVVGVLFNADTMTVSITEEKKAATLVLLRQAVSSKNISVGDLRVLGGKLNFLSAVVPFGRSYCSFVWRLAGDANGSPFKTKHVTGNLRVAVQWWIEVLEGKRFTVANMLLGTPEAPLFVVSGASSDACDWGFGGVSETHRWYIKGQWWASEVVDDAQINVRECFGALMMVAAMAQTGILNGTILVFQVDNECTMWGVNKGHSKKHVLNFLVHAFNVLQERYRFVIVMKHLAGVLNVKSDGISRNVDLASLGLSTANGWVEKPIPSAVRQLLLLALDNMQHEHVLEFCPEATQQSITLEDFVRRGMRTPTVSESHVSIPWVAFRDTLALTSTASATV